MSNVLVTGGAGFIGSHLCEALVERGHDVRVLDDLSTGFRENLASLEGGIDLVEGDASDLETALRVTEGVETVFHEAAIPSVPRSMKDPLLSHHACLSATITVLEACRRNGVKRLVYAASSSAYGDCEEFPLRETAAPRPKSIYAVAKQAGESYIRIYAQSLGLDGVSLRYFNIFGPRQDPNSPYSGVIAKFIRMMRAGERPTIFGDGLQSRDFTYVANAVQANLLAMERVDPFGGIVLNVGCGGRVTVLRLVQELNKALGTQLEPELLPPREGDIKHSHASLERTREVLGYVPQVDFSEGLRLTVEAELK